MTKIQEIARLTSLTKDANGNAKPSLTTISYKTVSELGANASLRQLALAAVYEYDEPLSVLEVSEHIRKYAPDSTVFHEATVRYYLDALLQDGDILMRVETTEERQVRARGIKVTLNKPARMYFRKGIGIPFRTTPELVPGVSLRGPGSHGIKKAKSTKAFNPRATAKEALGTPRPTGDMAALDFMIEKLVAERTAELQKKLDEANSKLAEFKKLLS